MNFQIYVGVVFMCIKYCYCHTVIDFVTSYGYPIEAHSNVTTQDGYILTLFRIPHGLKETETKTREPVLLVHPLSESCEVFVFLDPDKSLGFLLPDNGYDVWMMNVRSNSYSRKHVTLNPDRDKKAFWNFTLDELALDVSASIDYVLNITRFEKLMYAGHSQGGTLLAILLAEHPEYNEKVNLAVLLSPGIFLGGATNFFAQMFMASSQLIQDYFEAAGIYELHPFREISKAVGFSLCNARNLGSFCKLMVSLTAGWNPQQLDVKYMPKIANNVMEGMSLYEVIHYLQMFKTGKFRKFDYGRTKNLLRYGSEEPPDYNLNNIIAPTAIYSSKEDNITPYKGMRKFINLLPNVVDSYVVNDTLFTHLDFLIATDIVPLLYNRVIDLMETYRSK